MQKQDEPQHSEPADDQTFSVSRELRCNGQNRKPSDRLKRSCSDTRVPPCSTEGSLIRGLLVSMTPGCRELLRARAVVLRCRRRKKGDCIHAWPKQEVGERASPPGTRAVSQSLTPGQPFATKKDRRCDHPHENPGREKAANR